MAEAQAETTVQLGRIALGCSDCGEILTATVKGQHEAGVRHTREQTVATLTIEAPDFHAAVLRHRARGCPARHFKQTALPNDKSEANT
jgi:hypothetical protein